LLAALNTPVSVLSKQIVYPVSVSVPTLGSNGTLARYVGTRTGVKLTRPALLPIFLPVGTEVHVGIAERFTPSTSACATALNISVTSDLLWVFLASEIFLAGLIATNTPDKIIPPKHNTHKTIIIIKTIAQTGNFFLGVTGVTGVFSTFVTGSATLAVLSSIIYW
jgi:hypothetical protein